MISRGPHSVLAGPKSPLQHPRGCSRLEVFAPALWRQSGRSFWTWQLPRARLTHIEVRVGDRGREQMLQHRLLRKEVMPDLAFQLLCDFAKSLHQAPNQLTVNEWSR